MNFEKFDKKVNVEEINKAIAAAPAYDNEDVAAGTYYVTIERLELREQKKDPNKLMFSLGAKIGEAVVPEQKKEEKRWIFWNRTIFGNQRKTNKDGAETWSDGIAIKGVLTWLNTILAESDDDPLVFSSYSDLSDDLAWMLDEICPDLTLRVNYDPNAFNPLVIEQVIFN